MAVDLFYLFSYHLATVLPHLVDRLEDIELLGSFLDLPRQIVEPDEGAGAADASRAVHDDRDGGGGPDVVGFVAIQPPELGVDGEEVVRSLGSTVIRPAGVVKLLHPPRLTLPCRLVEWFRQQSYADIVNQFSPSMSSSSNHQVPQSYPLSSFPL